MRSPACSGTSSASEFPPTQWSLVLAASGSSGDNRALAELCGAYWQPLFAYVRRCGVAEALAKDLTQDFFLFLLERNVVARAERERGRFRTFLLTAMRHFMADQHDRRTAYRRGGGVPHVSWDDLPTEEADVTALPPSAPAEACFDATWAHTLAARALDLVRQSYVQRERAPFSPRFAAFSPGEICSRMRRLAGGSAGRKRRSRVRFIACGANIARLCDIWWPRPCAM